MVDYKETLADETATLAFGQRLALASADEEGRLRGGVFYLRGDLGAGKTTLTRGLLRGYGYEGAVKSPTYTLVEPYELPGGQFYHFDLYRLADPEEMDYLGVEDYFRPDSLCVVEWPEQGAGFLAEADLLITLDYAGAGRELHCEALSAAGQDVLQRLSAGGRSTE